MLHEVMRVETVVLVIGLSAAGMHAAIEAARAGCQVSMVVSGFDWQRAKHNDELFASSPIANLIVN
jgi:thioredoxin reductase